ncbi:MAG: DUF3821 domain-containing protein [Methanomicrobiales archaeon]|nr:DUF3821 domain-containing protein [Methanomicrobiales archaeon]
MVYQSLNSPRARGWLISPSLIMAILVTTMVLVLPAAARTGSIQAIDNADMIFVYEENLDISALRSNPANQITLLRKFVDDNPGKAVIREITVQDDTSYTVYASSVGMDFGIYYGYNPTDGNTGKYVRIQEPTVAIDAVLANPYHTDSIQGLNIPDTTAIAFKIMSPNVGSSYYYGTVYPATVDIVVTTPGGGELTIFQGRNFQDLNISSTEFYTDDPGEPGAFRLEEGTYQAQARWSNPASFDSQAPDSNILTWNIGATPTPTATATPTTVNPTTIPTTTPTATLTVTPPETVVTTTGPATSPPVTTPTTALPTSPSPTPTPLGPVLALGAMAMLALVLGRRAP